ncbi:elongation factor P [Patescibacteria group bacterium]
MLNASQLRNNTYFEYEGVPFKVLKYQHTHLGRGGANIKVKAKSLQNGNVRSFNFGSNDKFEEVVLEKKQMQFLYREEEMYFFMNPSSFEQYEIAKNLIGDQGKFLKEGEEITVFFWQDKPLDIDMPASLEVEILECDPGVKGNSATNIFKQATAKNGLNIRVPLFIKIGDKIKVDTRTGEYIERV